MSQQTHGRPSLEQADVAPKKGERRIRRVAVVAVHGVAKHPAGETQNAMADLLLSLPTGEYHAQRLYQPFRSVGLEIPLQPVRTGHEGRGPAPKRRWFNLFDLYQERSADLAQRLPREAGVPPAVGEVATEYNDLLLAHYEGGADTNAYITARLEGQRGKDGPEVHIYEMLWSDLAKPSSSVVSFFLALFQLLLHLASLSRTAIDTGAAETTGIAWKVYRRFQRYAVRMLQIFIPLLEILLFLALTSCFTTIAKPTSGKPAVAFLLGGAGLTGLAFVIFSSGKWAVRSGPWAWTLLALVPGALGSGIAWWLIHLSLDTNEVTALLWWLVPGVVLLGWILSNYEEVRSGAQVTGWVMYVVALVIFFCFLRTGPDSVIPSAFWLAELLLAAVRICWALLIFFAFAALFFGSYAWRFSWPKEKNIGEHKKEAANGAERLAQKSRARAAVRTSRLALALPSVMFLLITLLIWNGFTGLASKYVKDPLFDLPIRNRTMPGPWMKIVTVLHLLPAGGI